MPRLLGGCPGYYQNALRQSYLPVWQCDFFISMFTHKGDGEDLSCLIYQIKAPTPLVARASPIARIKVKRTVNSALFEPISLQRIAMVARQGM